MRVILDFIFDWLPFGIGVPLFIAVGFALLADEFKEFKAARVCFYVATAWVCGKVIMWSFFTSEKFPVRAIVVFLVCGFVGVGLNEALRLTNRRQVKIESPPAPNAVPPQSTSNAPLPATSEPTKQTPKDREAKPSPQQPPPIQIAPFFGNLKERCMNLAEELFTFHKERQKRKEARINSLPQPSDHKTIMEAYSVVNDSTTRLFRHDYLPRLLAIQKELADRNIKDDRFDQILANENQTIKYVEAYPDFPKESGYTNIMDVQILAERLRVLASKIPGEVPSSEVPVVRKLTFTQKDAVSSVATAPYAVEVVVQTNAVLQPASLTIRCDVEVDVGRMRVVGAGVLSNLGDGYVENKKAFWVFWGDPAFAPDKPLVVILMGKKPIRVLSVSEGPPFPF